MQRAPRAPSLLGAAAAAAGGPGARAGAEAARRPRDVGRSLRLSPLKIPIEALLPPGGTPREWVWARRGLSPLAEQPSPRGVRALPPRASLCPEEGGFSRQVGYQQAPTCRICVFFSADRFILCVSSLFKSPQSVVFCSSVADKSPEDGYQAASVLVRCRCGRCLSCVHHMVIYSLLLKSGSWI